MIKILFSLSLELMIICNSLFIPLSSTFKVLNCFFRRLIHYFSLMHCAQTLKSSRAKDRTVHQNITSISNLKCYSCMESAEAKNSEDGLAICRLPDMQYHHVLSWYSVHQQNNRSLE